MVPTTTKHDVVIIGGGPAGYAAALYGASAGLDCGIIEMNKLGGTCLNVGCIPAKELLETAAVFRTVHHAKDFGVNLGGDVTVDWSKTMRRKQSIIDQLVGGLGGLLKGRKVTVYDGIGSLGPDRTVSITGGESGDLQVTGDSVLLAAGSAVRTIPGFDIDGKLVVTSDELLSIEKLPERAVVIGGGAIGSEFASMMSDLGTEVTILEYAPHILPGVDADAAKIVERSFAKRGMNIKTGVMSSGHTPSGDTTSVHFAPAEGGDTESIETDLVVVSVGRRPLSDHLGLEGTGVVVDDRGFVEVDELMRTGEPGVYALGDVINTAQLAHIGFAEGMLVIQDILGEDPAPIDTKVPWCIYCHPEVAFAGHTEQSAKDAGYEVVTSKHRNIGNGRSMIIGDTDGLVKIIAEKNADGTGGQILGVHLVGPWVTEQLGQGYLAVNWEATVDDIAPLIQPHPTISEVFGETVLSLTGRSLH